MNEEHKSASKKFDIAKIAAVAVVAIIAGFQIVSAVSSISGQASEIAVSNQNQFAAVNTSSLIAGQSSTVQTCIKTLKRNEPAIYKPILTQSTNVKNAKYNELKAAADTSFNSKRAALTAKYAGQLTAAQSAARTAEINQIKNEKNVAYQNAQSLANAAQVAYLGDYYYNPLVGRITACGVAQNVVAGFVEGLSLPSKNTTTTGGVVTTTAPGFDTTNTVVNQTISPTQVYNETANSLTNLVNCIVTASCPVF